MAEPTLFGQPERLEAVCEGVAKRVHTALGGWYIITQDKLKEEGWVSHAQAPTNESRSRFNTRLEADMSISTVSIRDLGFYSQHTE